MEEADQVNAFVSGSKTGYTSHGRRGFHHRGFISLFQVQAKTWFLGEDRVNSFFFLILFILCMTSLIILWFHVRRQSTRLQEFEEQTCTLLRTQNEVISEKLSTTTDRALSEQRSLANLINTRLDSMSQRFGENLMNTSQKTSESLNQLYERLAVIDAAQNNITTLSDQFMTLQSILADKQARGAFGQIRMESIIKDALPRELFSFQATLSNNRRPDCLIALPKLKEKMVIDAKFPLESFQRIQSSTDEQTQRQAEQDFKRDILRHLTEIKARYFIPGETQDIALMFVPSESIYARLYEHFDDVIQKAYAQRIIIVSPNMLMLAVQVMQSIMRDAHVREQAHAIQKILTHLNGDVARLNSRVADLERHFNSTRQDIENISISARKIHKTITQVSQFEKNEEEISIYAQEEDKRECDYDVSRIGD